MDLSSKLEAVLFVAGDPVQVPELASILTERPETVAEALEQLRLRYVDTNAGLRLLQSPEGIQLVTAPEAQPAIESFLTASMRERLTAAAAETLALVAYRGPISRAGVEAIRGVNSSFTLRVLALRGLVTRELHPTDRRSYLYRLSADFLRHLGVTRMEDLPDYQALKAHAGMTKLVTEAEAAPAAPGESPPPGNTERRPSPHAH
jgi:segregation and condensation protein B